MRWKFHTCPSVSRWRFGCCRLAVHTGTSESVFELTANPMEYYSVISDSTMPIVLVASVEDLPSVSSRTCKCLSESAPGKAAIRFPSSLTTHWHQAPNLPSDYFAGIKKFLLIYSRLWISMSNKVTRLTAVYKACSVSANFLPDDTSPSPWTATFWRALKPFFRCQSYFSPHLIEVFAFDSSPAGDPKCRRSP